MYNTVGLIPFNARRNISGHCDFNYGSGKDGWKR